MLQHTVNRNYATGLIGEILRDGPIRANPARINNATATPNRVGRAFTYVGDSDITGATRSMLGQEVAPGGTGGFFGILGIPKHYALYGTNSPAPGEMGGPLSPTMDLPDGSEGEFVNMGIMLLELRNGADAAGVIPYNAQVYYCVAPAVASAGFVATTVADVGALFAFPAATDPATVPAAQFAPVPGGLVINALPSLAAGATAQTIVQLTK